MNAIRPYLWVSDIHQTRIQETDFLDQVVSVCQDTTEDNISQPYAHFRLADGPDVSDIYGGSVDEDLFASAVHTVRMAIPDRTTLVHCHMGQNRSVSVCTAALAVHEDLSFEEAFAEVEAVRPQANPTECMEQRARDYIEVYSNE